MSKFRDLKFPIKTSVLYYEVKLGKERNIQPILEQSDKNKSVDGEKGTVVCLLSLHGKFLSKMLLRENIRKRRISLLLYKTVTIGFIQDMLASVVLHQISQ